MPFGEEGAVLAEETPVKPHRMELLAPAGNMACLHAAVSAGADAVYLGAGEFNARRNAGNFTMEELDEACAYAHLRGVLLYLTVNTVVLPRELASAMELVRQAYRAGIDGFIVQDLGLAAEIHRTLPQAEWHASTQMNIHNAAGVQAMAALGAKRVTFARELSLAEVSELSRLARDLGMDTEMFAHGALCICYSGQCLMSSLVGGRSANRGLCAQACRLPYTLHNRAVRKELDAPGEYLLSPKDLCTVNLMDKLVDTGAYSLKIEGRMKSPEYVHSVVGVYRAVLDRVLAGRGPQHATEEEMRVLSEAFSRGFTEAYLTGDTGNDMMSYQRPNNRGVAIGRVASARDGLVSFHAEPPVFAGDVLEFWTNKGHFAYTVTDADRTGQDVRLAVPKRVGKGDRVFRLREAAAAFADDAHEPRVPVTGTVRLHIGQPLEIEFRLASGVSRSAQGPVVEPARTKAVTEQDVLEHVNRLGSTPFVLRNTADLAIELDEGVGIGFSQLHKVRSAALEELAKAQRAAVEGDRTLHRAPDFARPPKAHTRGCTVAVLAANPACARAAKRAGADALYVPALNYRRGTAMVGGQVSGTVEQAGYPNRCVMALPAISHDAVPGTREEKFDFDVTAFMKRDKPVLVQNYGQLASALDRGCRVQVGPHIPVMNREALDTVARLGAERVWLSPELSLGQIQDLAEDKPASLGLTVKGAGELMVTEHCLLMSQGPCNRNCADCARRKSPHYLKDRRDYEMPVVTDCCGRSHLYNAVPLDLTHLFPDLLSAGIDAVMVDATLMNVEETTEAVKRTVRARDRALQDGTALGKPKGGATTTGHIFRGVQ